MKKITSCFLACMLIFFACTVFCGAEMKSDIFTPVVGEWTFNEADQTITCGSGKVGDNYAGSGLFIAPGQEAVVTVDFRIDEYVNGCGAGLFFDPYEAEDRFGVGSGMGVLTWTGTDFAQFKTWCWNPVDVGTYGDFWNPVENYVFGDSETVLTVKVEFFSDDKIECTLINKSTGAEHVLEDGTLDLNNSDGVYVGLMALNCKATFSDFTFTASEIKETTASDVSETGKETTAAPSETTAEPEADTTAGPATVDTTDAPDTSDEAESNVGAIIGIIAAVLVAAAVIIFLVLKKKK